MQIHIIEVKPMIKNVNTYNMSSFLTNKLDSVPIVYHIEQNKIKCNLYETLLNTNN